MVFRLRPVADIWKVPHKYEKNRMSAYYVTEQAPPKLRLGAAFYVVKPRRRQFPYFLSQRGPKIDDVFRLLYT